LIVSKYKVEFIIGVAVCDICRKRLYDGDVVVVEEIPHQFIYYYCPECAEKLGICKVDDGFPKLL